MGTCQFITEHLLSILSNQIIWKAYRSLDTNHRHSACVRSVLLERGVVNSPIVLKCPHFDKECFVILLMFGVFFSIDGNIFVFPADAKTYYLHHGNDDRNTRKVLCVQLFNHNSFIISNTKHIIKFHQDYF